ncbi:MAG: hypothetical protein LBU32_12715 [Clostridiales bacterium]|jgi:hypothetical protein|nr:hypothetical protein [Clostridiales bacterium]
MSAFDSKTGAAPAQILNNEKTNETAVMPTPLSNIGSGAEGSTAAADAPDARKEAAKCKGFSDLASMLKSP